MKMQHQISAPVTGTLHALHVTEGRQVELGTLLAVVTATGQGAGNRATRHPQPADRRTR
jgi:propionyl-CoA carboxylase alpha chain